MGLLLPVAVALALQLAQLLPLPVAVRLALPSYAFVARNGLFTDLVRTGPLLISSAVSLTWAVLATAPAHLLFLRRDFTHAVQAGAGRRARAAALLAPAALVALTVVVVAAAIPSAGSGIRQDKVQRSLATAFAHLYRVQARQLHRPDVTEARLRATAACTKGAGRLAAQGPGNDWRCVVSWHLPGVDATGQAVYQLDVTADGRFVADGDGPKEVNGYFPVHTPAGDAPNPLWQFDGTVDLLSTISKG